MQSFNKSKEENSALEDEKHLIEYGENGGVTGLKISADILPMENSTDLLVAICQSISNGLLMLDIFQGVTPSSFSCRIAV